MELTGRIIQVSRDWISGKLHILLSVNEEPSEEINALINCEKLSVRMKKYRQRRSLDANGYLWVLCTEIANHPDIRSSKDEIYEEMLQKYGYLYEDDDGYISITVKAAVDMSKIDGHWKFYKSNGKFSSYLKIKGSSEYNTAEMAQFIDMVVQEAKELGIDTMPPKKLERMLEKWQSG